MKKQIGIIGLIVFLFDRFSKYTIRNAFEVNLFSARDGIDVVPNILKLNYYKNTGIALGLFQNANSFFIFVTAGLIAILIFMVLTDRLNGISPIFIGLILGGAIGNLFDRVVFGAVIDFINLKIFSVFNIADICISTGSIGAVIQSATIPSKKNN